MLMGRESTCCTSQCYSHCCAIPGQPFQGKGMGLSHPSSSAMEWLQAVRRFAPVTSGCKQRINTGAAEELAATKIIFPQLFNRKISGLHIMLNVLYSSASSDSHHCLLMHDTPQQKLLRGYELLMTQKKTFKKSAFN